MTLGGFIAAAVLLPILAAIALFALGGPIRRNAFENTKRIHA